MEFLEQISSWINANSADYNPAIAWSIKIVAAVVTFFVGYIIAKMISGAIGGGINRIPFVRSANEGAANKKGTIGASIGKIVFYLLLLAVAAISLAMVGLTGVVEPVQGMWDTILNFLPKFLMAGVTLGFGLLFANILRKLVKTVLETANVDSLASPVEGERAEGLSEAISWIVFTPVALFVITAGVEVLGIDAVSGPASLMLEAITKALPNVAAAGIVLALAYFIARFASKLLEIILPPTGVNTYVEKLGLLENRSESGLTATKVISHVAGLAIMLVGAVEATKLLNFQVLSDFVQIVLEQGGQILFGTVIIAVGFFFANIVSKVLDATGSGFSDTLAKIVKYVLMAFAVIVGIARMGLDPTGGEFILDISRYLVIALAVAVGVGGAIAFGLGGKDWAREKLQKWWS